MLALTESHKVWSWGTGLVGQLGRIGARVSERHGKAIRLSPALVPLKRSMAGAKIGPRDIAASDGAAAVCSSFLFSDCVSNRFKHVISLFPPKVFSVDVVRLDV